MPQQTNKRRPRPTCRTSCTTCLSAKTLNAGCRPRCVICFCFAFFVDLDGIACFLLASFSCVIDSQPSRGVDRATQGRCQAIRLAVASFSRWFTSKFLACFRRSLLFSIFPFFFFPPHLVFPIPFSLVLCCVVLFLYPLSCLFVFFSSFSFSKINRLSEDLRQNAPLDGNVYIAEEYHQAPHHYLRVSGNSLFSPYKALKMCDCGWSIDRIRVIVPLEIT